MKRLLAAGLVAAAALVPAAPANAIPGGRCSGSIDAMCRMDGCTPDYPCTPMVCAVWYKNSCRV